LKRNKILKSIIVVLILLIVISTAMAFSWNDFFNFFKFKTGKAIELGCDNDGMCDNRESYDSCDTDCVIENPCDYDGNCNGEETVHNCVDCPYDLPTNKNALCVYNNNTEISRKICNYYANKRPGVHVLGLNVSFDKFIDIQKPLVSDYGRGEVAEGELMQNVDGVVGNALKFDGYSDYIMIDDKSLYPGDNDFTWAGWVMVNGIVPSTQMIFMPSGSINNGYTVGWRITTNSGGDGIIISGGDKTTHIGGITAVADTEPETWYHVAFTRDKSTNNVRAYLNGELVEERTLNYVSNITHQRWIFIARNVAGTRYFNGTLDEVRYYSRVLSEAEINELYKLNNVEGDLELYWPFDEVYRTENRSYEDMNRIEFEEHVLNPILSYTDEHPEFDITHLAVAKDLPTTIWDDNVVSAELSKKYIGALSFFAFPYYNISNSERVASSYYFNNKRDLKHFDPGEYYNEELGEYKIRFATSYLNGYNLENIKKMIDKAVAPAPDLEGVKWVCDADGIGVRGNFLPSYFYLVKDNLVMKGIQEDNVIIEDTKNIPFVFNDDIIAYTSPGYWHKSYWSSWMFDGKVQIKPVNRAIMTSIESHNAQTFKQDEFHGNNYQGKLAQAFMPNSFGGSDYSNIFAGAAGHVHEPYLFKAVDHRRDFFDLYYEGLTLGEVGLMLTGDRWMNIFVGDPLMMIRDEPKTGLADGELCSSNEECRNGYCNKGLNLSNGAIEEVRFCHGNDDNCIYIYNEDKIFEKINGYGECINETHARECIDGEWSDYIISEDRICRIYMDGWIFGFIWTKKDGEECIEDDECSRGYCDYDLEGVKRCNYGEGYCVIGEGLGSVGNGNYACINDNQKRRCVDAGWTDEIVNCGNGCLNGWCIGEGFIPPDRFILSPGENRYLSLPIYPGQLDDPEAIKIKNVFRSFTGSFFPAAADSVYKFSEGSWTAYGKSEKGEWKKTNDWFNGEPVDVEIAPGEGFYVEIKEHNPEQELVISGTTFEDSVSVVLEGMYSLIGIPYCAEKYTASSLLAEIRVVAPECNAISMANSDGGPIPWWSFDEDYDAYGIKKDFPIFDYMAYWIYCDAETDFVWTPSCSIAPVCDNDLVCEEGETNENCASDCECDDDGECDDGNLCTDDSCVGHQCVSSYNVALCDDNDACTVADTCSEGQCVGTAKDCSDGLSYTIDSCDRSIGCIFENQMPDTGAFDSELTTDLTVVSDLSNVINFTIGNKEKGKILFNGSSDLRNLNLTKYIKIEDNSVKINISYVLSLNKSSIITLYNISYVNPVIIVNGEIVEDIQIISYENGTLIFIVDHWTKYEVVEGPYCGDDNCNGDESCSSCSDDCGSCGDGGSGSSLCRSIWVCKPWGSCKASQRERKCYDKNYCRNSTNVPETKEECECKESWRCYPWEPKECPSTGIQTRECFDLYICGTEELKPDTRKTCEYVAPVIIEDDPVVIFDDPGEQLEDVEDVENMSYTLFDKIIYCFSKKDRSEVVEGQELLAPISCDDYYIWPYIILGVLILVILASVGLVVKNKSNNGETSNNLIDQRLIELQKYIEKALFSGYDEIELKKSLINMGWEENALNYVFEQVKKKYYGKR